MLVSQSSMLYLKSVILRQGIDFNAVSETQSLVQNLVCSQK